MLNNEKIRDVINTIGEKGVLILGRFIEDRKAVLDAIRDKLRELGFVPMMFDFEKPSQRDFTETIKTLAGLSRFIGLVPILKSSYQLGANSMSVQPNSIIASKLTA